MEKKVCIKVLLICSREVILFIIFLFHIYIFFLSCKIFWTCGIQKKEKYLKEVVWGGPTLGQESRANKKYFGRVVGLRQMERKLGRGKGNRVLSKFVTQSNNRSNSGLSPFNKWHLRKVKN
jgi:hypothetical protein